MGMKFAALALALSASMAVGATLDKGKAFGNPAAPITIEIFSDFQCPACRMLHTQLLPSIMRDFVVPGRAYLVYKEFPLPMHSYSRQAAAYACAAARIGKYEQVADVLFANQPSWSENGKVFDTVASALTPAEQQKVKAMAQDPSITGEVQEDVNEGNRERINSTPTMIIIKGGRKYPIAQVLNYDLLKRFLDDLK